MICKPCREAGKDNRVANIPGANAEHYRAQAERYHQHCEAPTTCPCHHLLGQYTELSSRT